MAEKKESEYTSTYCHIMKGKTWRAALFDWQFENRRSNERSGVIQERQRLIKMVKRLNFTIYKDESIPETRSLSMTNFLKELQDFKKLCVSEPCGCILLTISSHGKFVKAHQRDGDLKIFDDCILTCDSSSEIEEVRLKEIFEVFRDKDLKQIPKIFFIQACRGKDVDEGYLLSGNEIDEQVQHRGYAAGSNRELGSRVWIVLMDTLDKILTQEQNNGPVNLLFWLKETNRELANLEFEMHNKNNPDKNIQYKPILSICHTLTKHIILKKVGQ